MLHFEPQRIKGWVFTRRYVSHLVDVLCKSVGVLLAVVHAGGAGALSRGPAEEAAATSLTGADRGPPRGDPTWLPVRGPEGLTNQVYMKDQTF